MSVFKALLGLKDIEVSGNLQVRTFQERFFESFGTEIRVYKPKSDGTINTGKGSVKADGKHTLASIAAKGSKVEDLTIKKSKTVSQVEESFAKDMGIGVQIMTPDGKGFAPNDAKLKDVAKLG
jgi:hypothetical protein